MGSTYYYGGESEQFSCFRIPRQLITGENFKSLSTDAKLLYGLLLGRVGLSARNGWYDGLGRVSVTGHKTGPTVWSASHNSPEWLTLSRPAGRRTGNEKSGAGYGLRSLLYGTVFLLVVLLSLYSAFGFTSLLPACLPNRLLYFYRYTPKYSHHHT